MDVDFLDGGICDNTCPGDVNLDGVVDINDLLAVISNWGTPGCGGVLPCYADVNGDGNVDVSDQLAVIRAWGPCP